MGYYRNPLIGWFLKKKLKLIFFLFTFTFILYILIFKPYIHKISYGCNRPDCNSTECTGEECNASGCYGDNCKGGDCYGEECRAGDCQGVGCRAGDCFGKDCIPGKCIDPECSKFDADKGICKPFCKDGNAYDLPSNNFYNLTNKFPEDSILNPNYCKLSKPAYILKNKKYIWNYMIDYANFEFSGKKTPEEIENPEPLQDGKRFILSDDINFISTYPLIQKKYNCNWCTKMKNNEICATYKPYKNEITGDYSWHPDEWKCDTLNQEGRKDGCKTKNDDMKLIKVESVDFQINKINYSKKSIAEKNYEIDDILGEMLYYQCKNNKICKQHINLKKKLYLYNGKSSPCLRRAYLGEKKKINNLFEYVISNFESFQIDSYEQELFLYNNYNKKRTFRDHHVWIYDSTSNNNQIYRCYWCEQYLVIQNQALPIKADGSLNNCYYSNDYNHNMYQKVDENKNVYLKCLKCNKEAYFY